MILSNDSNLTDNLANTQVVWYRMV